MHQQSTMPFWYVKIHKNYKTITVAISGACCYNTCWMWCGEKLEQGNIDGYFLRFTIHANS